MKHNRIITIFLLSTIFLTGCTGNSRSNISNDDSFNKYVETGLDNYIEENDIVSNYEESENLDTIFENQKLIYRGSLEIETTSYNKSVSDLEKLVDNNKGFIESNEEESLEYDDYSRRANMVIRIPSKSFDNFMNSVGDIGHVRSNSMDIENITREYNDVSTQIASLEIQKDRLLAMYDNAQDIDDMISIESRLSEVQSDLARINTQKRTYDINTNLSTIEIKLVEVGKIEDNRYLSRLKNAFYDSFNIVKNLFDEASIFVVTYLPLSLIIICIVMLCIKIVKHYTKKKPKDTSVDNQEEPQEAEINIQSNTDNSTDL